MGLKDLSTGLKDLFKRKRKRAPPPAPSPPPLPPPQPLIPRPPLLRPPPPPYSPSPPPPPPPPPPPSFTPSPLPPPSLPLTPPRPQPLPRPQRRPTPRPQRQSFPPVPTTRPRKPVAPNPATGRYSSYYSTTWATQARNPGTNETKKQDHSLCECCKKRPKFKDATKVHPYCGLTCAKHAASTRNNLVTPSGPSSGQTCRTPGCKFPVHVYPDGTSSNYCMIAHKEWGARGCISCRAAPMNSTSVLCQSCHNDALSKAPTIIEVPDDHDNYMSVEGQFKRSWRHKTTCPEVMAIHKIIVTETSLRQYQQYQDSVESRGNFSTKGKYRGNEHRRWHGTKRKCNFGDQECNTFCADPGCSLCSIIKSSFDVKFFKTATGWGRFGHGIYTSSTSSKSNDYSKNIGINSDRKALLLNKVIVGNGKKYSQNNTSLTQPPPGYDSVIAEVVPGGTLNYDELVVYNNDAVRPSYLVMYKSP